LGSYRDVRVEFTQPEVTDEDVDRALQSLLEGEAESEETEGPVEAGDRITVDIHSFFVNEEQDAAAEGETQPEAEAGEGEGAEASSDEGDEHDHGDIHEHDGEPFIHEHGLQVILHEGDDEPLGPGFTAQMIGASVGETREFNITYP